MSDQSQGPGWWEASDGKWYPPSASAEPPGEGWWLASDGQWYPPREEPPVPGWWLASDGRWYPPADPEPERPLLADARSGPVAAPPPPEGSPMLLAGLPETLTAPAPPKAERNGSSKSGATAQPRRERASRAGRASLAAARTPQEQIARRDDASRLDAEVVAAARSKAALGALATLRAQIEAESSQAPADPVGSPSATPPPAAADQPVAAANSSPAPEESQDDGATLVRSPDNLPGAGTPLLELRQSAVVSDIDKLGDRLAVYEDRVSMLDRHDNVRERIDGHEIADVVLAKKLTGWTVTVESGSGSTITVKGLRQDQAEEVRSLIMGRTRRSGPVPSRGRRGAAPSGAEPPPRPAPPAASDRSVTDITDAATPVDPVRLLAMLDELHHHHVLSEDELAEKRRVVEQLAATHQLAPTTTF